MTLALPLCCSEMDGGFLDIINVRQSIETPLETRTKHWRTQTKPNLVTAILTAQEKRTRLENCRLLVFSSWESRRTAEILKRSQSTANNSYHAKETTV